MKKNALFSHVYLFVAVVAAFALAPSARAAERQAQFKVSDKQMLMLGIQVVPLQRQSSQVVVSLPAQVVMPPSQEQIISAPFAGLAVQLFVQQNQVVKQGAPLVRIVSAEFGQLQLQLLQAASRAALARQTAERERALFDEGIIPQRRVQESQAALKDGEAALYQARSALGLTGLPPASIERIAASGKLEDSLTLRATQGGIVTSVDVRLGQRVDATSALLRIAQTGSLWLDIQAPSADAANWKPGSKIKLQGRDGTARIVSVGSMVTAGSQTVALRAAIESGSAGLRPGEFVTAELPAGGGEDGWNVPLSAVAHDGKQAYVFVRTADGFDARPVTVAASAGQRIRLDGRLKADERVAVSGVVALKGAWLDDKADK